MSFSYENMTLPIFLNFDSNKENVFEGFDFGLAEKIISEGLHPTCAICLNKSISPCMPNSCCHTFCFRCLKYWAKMKKICPLCRKSFRKIIKS